MIDLGPTDDTPDQSDQSARPGWYERVSFSSLTKVREHLLSVSVSSRYEKMYVLFPFRELLFDVFLSKMRSLILCEKKNAEY